MAKAKTKVESTQEDLAAALAKAIESTKPVAKKTTINRTKATPWTPKDGSPKLKLKRKMYQHGLLIDTERISNDEISLLNKVKPGVYFDGHVRVNRRKDRGYDIDYPVKTASQRLKLVNQFGIRNFWELVDRIVQEAASPRKEEIVDNDD